jgi:hypothetical protein
VTDIHTPEHDHERLARSFRSLRREVQESAPNFGALAKAPRIPARRLRLGWATLGVAVTVTGGALLFANWERYPTVPDAFNVALWQAPTDFLLNSRTRDILRTVPSFGESSIQLFEPDDLGVPDTSTERRM